MFIVQPPQVQGNNTRETTTGGPSAVTPTPTVAIVNIPILKLQPTCSGSSKLLKLAKGMPLTLVTPLLQT